jgi:hypothetical protein
VKCHSGVIGLRKEAWKGVFGVTQEVDGDCSSFYRASLLRIMRA